MTEPGTVETRAARRARERAAGQATLDEPVLPALATVCRPVLTLASVGLCLVLAVCALAGQLFLAAALALTCSLLVWGWPGLNTSPSRVGSSVVLGLSTAGCLASVLVAREDPFLRHLPIALAGSLLALFVHQLVRRDGRPRLTESVAISAAGIALVASAVAYLPLPLTPDGVEATVAALAAIAAGSLADLLAGRRALRSVMLPVAMALGAAASAGVMAAVGLAEWGVVVLLGVVAAAVSHALRRVLSVLPPIDTRRGQVVAAAAGVLVCGAVVYVPSRLLLG